MTLREETKDDKTGSLKAGSSFQAAFVVPPPAAAAAGWASAYRPYYSVHKTAKKQPENRAVGFSGCFGVRDIRALLSGCSAEKAHFYLDQFFDFGQGAAAGNEDDQVVAVGEFEIVVAAHHHFFAAHHGGEVAA